MLFTLSYCANLSIGQERLKQRRLESIQARVAAVQKSIEQRKNVDKVRLRAVDLQFASVLAVREACMKAARKKLLTATEIASECGHNVAYIYRCSSARTTVTRCLSWTLQLCGPRGGPLFSAGLVD